MLIFFVLDWMFFCKVVWVFIFGNVWVQWSSMKYFCSYWEFYFCAEWVVYAYTVTYIWPAIIIIAQSTSQPCASAAAAAFAPRVCTLVPFIINPRRACAARVTVVVLCVCLFVHDYSRTTGYEAAYERYQHLQCHKGMKIKIAILLKRLRSRDNIIVKTSKKPICPAHQLTVGMRIIIKRMRTA